MKQRGCTFEQHGQTTVRKFTLVQSVISYLVCVSGMFYVQSCDVIDANVLDIGGSGWIILNIGLHFTESFLDGFGCRAVKIRSGP